MHPITAVVPAPVHATPADGEYRFGPDSALAGGEVAEDLAAAWALPRRTDGTVRLELDPSRGELGGEGYELTVRPEGVRLVAPARAGLVHGAATLRQLRGTGDRVPAGRIVDHPRYPYRGLMLDVARRYFGVPDVLRLVDLAALVKLNHLHLHLTDDQGWRIAIDSWPRLAGYGGGTEVGDGRGGYYTKADYATIVAYAARHGITVVPEIDIPGHTNAALASYPELNAGGVAPPRYTGTEVGFSCLAVGAAATDRFLDEVFGELAAMTPGPYLHFGGDEVTTLDAEAYAAIVARAQEAVLRHGKVPIGWHEIAPAGPLPGTVLQYWGVGHADHGMAAATARGNRVIMSPADRAYLDMKYDESTPCGLDWAGFLPTRATHEWDPAAYLPAVQPSAVLGVEAPLWTETVRTLAEAQRLLMPRLAILAELAWSRPGGAWEDLRRRLATQAALWTRQGIAFHRDPEVPWD